MKTTSHHGWTAAILLLIGAMPVSANSNIEDLFENVSLCGEGGLSEARASANAHAASTGENLGYHSLGLEERSFVSEFTPPEFPEGMQGDYVYGLAIFSDDGCRLKINGRTVHDRFRKGQALPKLGQSFHDLPVLLTPGEPVQIELDYSNTHFITSGGFADIDGVTIYIYRKTQKLGLAVDADRDGRIRMGGDRTSADRPYRFWINNDEDRKEDVENGVAKRLDYADEKIRTQRDLEDFTRLQMMVGDYHEELKSGEVRAVLKFREDQIVGAPAIRVWPHLDPGGSRDYLIDEQSAELHTELDPLGTVAAGQDLEIPAKYWAGQKPFREVSAITAQAPVRHLLYEGLGTGQGALVLELFEGERSLGSSNLCWLRLFDVHEMYQRAKVTPEDPDQIPEPSEVFGEEDSPVVAVPEPVMGWTWDPWGKDFVKDPDEERTYIIFTHGWRMTYTSSQKYGETMFKRLWQAGYKGRFLFIRWPTYSESTHQFTKGFLTYNLADYRAWKSGKAVAQIVNSLPSSYTKNTCAHSMGNIVMGSAFREGMDANSYALLNAAVPAICFDDDAKLHGVEGPFPDDDADPITKSLGFERKLDVPGETDFINFYLSQDEALAIWKENNKRFKPNRLVIDTRPSKIDFSIAGYHYLPKEAPGARLQFRGTFKSDRHLRAFHEAAAYAIRSKTKAVGAEAGANGKITEKIDMGKEFGFGKAHSAQWRWRGQRAMPFFSQVMKSFGLKPTL